MKYVLCKLGTPENARNMADSEATECHQCLRIKPNIKSLVCSGGRRPTQRQAKSNIWNPAQMADHCPKYWAQH